MNKTKKVAWHKQLQKAKKAKEEEKPAEGEAAAAAPSGVVRRPREVGRGKFDHDIRATLDPEDRRGGDGVRTLEPHHVIVLARA